MNKETLKKLLKSAIVDAHTEVANADPNSKFWSEPKPPYNPTYPYNHITETESGHVFELDDSKNAERVHLAHRTGTFFEMHPDGTKVEKIVKDNYTIVLGNDKVMIYGNANITIQKDATVYVQQNCNLFVDGDMNMKIKNNMNVDIGKDLNWNISGSMNLGVKDDVKFLFGKECSWNIGQNFNHNVLGDVNFNVKGNNIDTIGGTYTGNYASGYENNSQSVKFTTPVYFVQSKSYLSKADTHNIKGNSIDMKSIGETTIIGSKINLNP